MNRKTRMLLGAAVLTGLVVVGVASRIESADPVKPLDRMTVEQKTAVQGLKAFSDGFAAVAEAVIPSVVTVTSERVVQPADSPFARFGQDPFFRRFFGETPEQRPFKQQGLGSGIIVSEDGYILTNNHVIRGADALTVILHDGTHLSAEVVGTDARTDVAVLRVQSEDLPAITFGDSDRVRIGEWVLAVGSPFSDKLQATTTAGIVSAVGRSGMNLNDYENFIQTDAAINPGNSGGALVNLDGELIGINTAIASRAGGSNGIGFAIPANMAMEVMDDLITDGKVSRGWLGINIQNVDPDLAQALDLDAAHGILVSAVVEDSPAGEAGLEQGDVIVRFAGKEVRTTDELRLAVARTDPGTRSEVVVIRDGKRKRFLVELGEYPEEGTPAAAALGESSRGDLGLAVEAITPDLARRFEIEDTRGLVVTSVEPGGPAEDEGIQVGDVIRKVNRAPVDSVREYEAAVDSNEKGKPVLLLVQRGDNKFFAAIRPDR